MSAKLRGLYAVTPDGLPGEVLLARVGAVLAGGCRLLQYRDKLSPVGERLARARALRQLTRQHQARLLINDDVALAHQVEADGVHLGAGDGSLVMARAVLGPDRLLGASCYADPAAARAAVAAGADYVAFGAVFASSTKPGAVSAPLGLFADTADLPVARCAIGGITLARAPAVLAAGADLLAVITDVFEAADCAAQAAAYQRLFEESDA